MSKNYTPCVKLHTVWKITDCVQNYTLCANCTLCVKLPTVCKITHCVYNYTLCVKVHTVCKILRWLSKKTFHFKLVHSRCGWQIWGMTVGSGHRQWTQWLMIWRPWNHAEWKVNHCHWSSLLITASACARPLYDADDEKLAIVIDHPPDTRLRV